MPEQSGNSETATSSSNTEPPEKIRPFDARMLDVGDGHWIYVEEVGVRGGVPALFLHGGPGSGAQHGHRSLFDPAKNHGILFDQRGAGRSHPYLHCDGVTTDAMVDDIERIRMHLGIERWIVTGGSWGSTLALKYAESHPDRVAALVLRAIFLGTRAEVEWAFVEGPRRFRPELFAAFLNFLPAEEHSDPLTHYVRRVLDPDPAIHRPVAFAWSAYERALSELEPKGTPTLPVDVAPDARLPPTACMEAYFIAHDFFLSPNELVANAHRLNGIPGLMVQGRYDLLCPPQAAHDIAERWTSGRLEIAPRAGHSITEPGVFETLQASISDFTRDFRR